MKHTRIDMLGLQFGRLTVQQFAHTANGRAMWLCRCDCGESTLVSGKVLRSGHTQSCGCLGAERRVETTRKHGRSRKNDRTYNCWKDMRKRCNNPQSQYYYRYGGRGITVCERWASFENFLSDMGECPTGYTIERKNIDKGYTPENCMWIHASRQARNTSKSRYLTAFGETMLLIEWAEKTGIPVTNLAARINKLGWPVEKAIATPVRKTKPRSA